VHQPAGRLPASCPPVEHFTQLPASFPPVAHFTQLAACRPAARLSAAQCGQRPPPCVARSPSRFSSKSNLTAVRSTSNAPDQLRCNSCQVQTTANPCSAKHGLRGLGKHGAGARAADPPTRKKCSNGPTCPHLLRGRLRKPFGNLPPLCTSVTSVTATQASGDRFRSIRPKSETNHADPPPRCSQLLWLRGQRVIYKLQTCANAGYWYSTSGYHIDTSDEPTTRG
jgi:hypothetical protein